MTKNNKHKTHKYRKHNTSRKHATRKHKHKYKQFRNIPNRNPHYINQISQIIFDNAPKKIPPLANSVALLEQNNDPASYSPTVNKELVMLQSTQRNKVHNCNNEKAFELKEPLQIGIPGNFFGKNCFPYYDPKAVKYLLNNLSANKHINIEKIVPPVQNQSNCWFNTMFVTLFVSDKGRKFFHFFRQLMIEGIQANGELIPQKLRNGFALLNYAIESCLTGNKYAYILDTNAIIRNIFIAIPESYKKKLPFIMNVGESGNPMYYYGNIIYYLHNKSLQFIFIQQANEKWKEKIIKEIKTNHLPHFIILEIYDGPNKTAGVSGVTTNKPRSFFIKGAKYTLDSSVIRDTTQQHFCATLTCENKEMAYDGMSYHRLVPLEWKKYINSDFSWGFEGSNNTDGTPLQWNFTHGYHMLIYYRVK
jgi:hypothetical protein